MNHTLLISALLATVGLCACDRPTVVNVPPPAPAPAPAPPVPGPPGPQGATGEQGKPSGDTVIIVTPPASAPTN